MKQQAQLVALLCALAILATGCGTEGQPAAVWAQNPGTGEVQPFPSLDAVPAEWVLCSDERCLPADADSCQGLSEDECELHPDCQLQALWCPQGAQPDDSASGCALQCLPKGPPTCDQITAEAPCDGRTDCEWVPEPCPGAPCVDGQPCPSCSGSCQPVAPALCQSLDQPLCDARADCQWQPGVCPAYCPDGTDCSECAPGSCSPVGTPPPCDPSPVLPAGFCAGGTIAARLDQQGCVVGYRCEMPELKDCWDLDAAYRQLLQQAKQCDPYVKSSSPQCSKQLPGGLFCAGCPTFVNPANLKALASLADIQLKWKQLGCATESVACPAIACNAPQSASCLPHSAAGGSCTDDLP